MGKTPYDVALLLDAILDTPPHTSFTSSVTESWSNLSVGFVDYKTWWHDAGFLKPVEDATNQMVSCVQRACQKLSRLSITCSMVLFKTPMIESSRVPNHLPTMFH